VAIPPAAPYSLFVALLLGAAIADVRWRRIPNTFTLALLVCGAAASLSRAAAPPFLSSATAFGVVFLSSMVAWRLRLCGGGDAKLAAAAATWVGLSRLPQFAFGTAIAGGLVSIVSYALSFAVARRASRVTCTATPGPTALIDIPRRARVSVPYGTAIALGALYAVFGVKS
jgi:prepilin peptidase CpaA